MGDISRLKPKETDGVENVIVVDGIPQVAEDSKLEKLKSVITKMFSKFGTIASEDFPVGEDGISKGYKLMLERKWILSIFLICRYCFIEFTTAAAAEEAAKATNDYKFDKNHTFAVNLFTDFDK